MTTTRLVFESSWGVTVMYGNGATCCELLDSFFEDKMVFGNPPYRLDVREIDDDEPHITFEQLVSPEARS